MSARLHTKLLCNCTEMIPIKLLLLILPLYVLAEQRL